MEKLKHINFKLYSSIFITYILICSIIVGLFTFGLYVSHKMISNDIKQLGESKLDLITAQVTGELVRYVQLCDTLAVNSMIKGYAEIPDGNTAELGMGAYYLQRELTDIGVSASLNNLAIFYPGNNSLVTMVQGYDVHTMSWFMNRFDGLSEDWLISLMEDTQSNLNLNAMSIEHTWITRKVKDGKDTIALIIVDYDFTRLIDSVINENEVVLIGNGSQLLFSNKEEFSTIQYAEIQKIAEANQIFQYIESDYISTYKTLPYLNGGIIVGIPFDNFLMNLKTYRWIIGLIIISGVLISVIISILLSRKIYLPMQSIAYEMSNKGENATFINVLKSAKNKLVSLIGETDTIRNELNTLLPLALGKMLLKLSESDSRQLNSISEYIMSMATLSAQKGFVVFAVHYTEDTSKFFKDKNNDVLKDKRLGLEFFVLENVMSDLLFHEHQGKIAYVENYYVIMAECENDSKSDLITDAVQKLVSLYKETFGVSLTVTNPVYGQTPEDLRDVFNQVHEEITYSMFWRNDDQDQESTDDDGNFSAYMSYMHSLINCINTQNYEEAFIILQRILEEGLPKNARNLNTAIYRVYGMIGMIVSAVDEQSNNDKAFIEKLNYEERLYRVRDIQSFKDETQKILAELIAYKQNNKDLVVPKLVKSIERFIAEHYMENDISVSSIAKHFNISESQLARIFKKTNRCNVLQYLQLIRVEKSKAYLKTDSIKDVALKVGFWDAQAYIRVFKKFEGITPGNYKKMQ